MKFLIKIQKKHGFLLTKFSEIYKINLDILDLSKQQLKETIGIDINTGLSKDYLRRMIMENYNVKLPINIYSAAKYMVRLFYHQKEEYYCTRSKVEKMLAIAQFYFLNHYQAPLFSPPIKINSCGVGFETLVGYLPNDINRGTIELSNKPLKLNYNTVLSNLATEDKLPKLYISNENDIPEPIKKLFIHIFIKFGNYEPQKLGKLLDEFKNDISVEQNLEPYVDNDVAIDFFKTTRNTKNLILKFIINTEIYDDEEVNIQFKN